MFFKELETERLILKNISTEDREFIFDQFSNASVNQYLFDAEPLVDLQGADEIIDFYLQSEPRPQHRWILNPDFEGNGYMIEAIRAIIRFAQIEMKLKSVNACIYVGNEKSIKLAEKAGFNYHGETMSAIFRETAYPHKIFHLDLSV